MVIKGRIQYLSSRWISSLEKVFQCECAICMSLLPTKAASRRLSISCEYHDDVIKWKVFPRYGPFVRGGGSPVIAEFPSQRSAMALVGFFIVVPHRLLNKQSNDRWFETTCHLCDVILMPQRKTNFMRHVGAIMRQRRLNTDCDCAHHPGR